MGRNYLYLSDNDNNTDLFIFDNQGLLGYKDSPLDRGKNIFLKLFKNRIYLE